MIKVNDMVGMAETVDATNEMNTTIAIVDDDASVRRSLTGILQRSPGIKCVGNYASAESAIEEVPRLAPQILLMDINLPGMDGVACVRQLARLAPKTQIIMLTVHDDTTAIFNSLAAGASGYLLKPVRATDLIAAVRDVFAGGAPMTSNIARKVVQSFKQTPPAGHVAEELSPRELEVLDCLTKGFVYKEIAEHLEVSYATVRTHIERIYEKLHVRSRSEAVAKYHHL
ncbi:MAG TPA: response regulator transcription factor [Verrucomicrobiae bacterium]|jgi:DNA-binding NarL/FixJ family response regulator|nr:response regulator transcription factor [Verrucomicrobiae bacterium]